MGPSFCFKLMLMIIRWVDFDIWVITISVAVIILAMITLCVILVI